MKRWRQTDRWTGEMGSGDGCFRSGRWGLVRVFSGYLLASRPTRLFARSVPRGLLQLSAITHRHGRQLPSPVIRLYGLQPPTHTCTHALCTHTCAHMLRAHTRAHMLRAHTHTCTHTCTHAPSVSDSVGCLLQCCAASSPSASALCCFCFLSNLD